MLRFSSLGALGSALVLGSLSGSAARGADGWFWLAALLLVSAGLVAVLQQTLA